MEQLALNFRTLPGCSTSYSLIIGANNSAEKETKIISAKDFKRYKKLDRRDRKKKKKKKKKYDTVDIVVEEFPENKSPQHVDSKNYAILQSPATLKRQSIELADNIEEGIKKYGDNNEAINYGFAAVEGKKKEFIEAKKEEQKAINANYV
jgi:hypothetical protein